MRACGARAWSELSCDLGGPGLAPLAGRQEAADCRHAVQVDTVLMRSSSQCGSQLRCASSWNESACALAAAAAASARSTAFRRPASACARTAVRPPRTRRNPLTGMGAGAGAGAPFVRRRRPTGPWQARARPPWRGPSRPPARPCPCAARRAGTRTRGASLQTWPGLWPAPALPPPGRGSKLQANCGATHCDRLPAPARDSHLPGLGCFQVSLERLQLALGVPSGLRASAPGREHVVRYALRRREKQGRHLHVGLQRCRLVSRALGRILSRFDLRLQVQRPLLCGRRSLLQLLAVLRGLPLPGLCLPGCLCSPPLQGCELRGQLLRPCPCGLHARLQLLHPRVRLLLVLAQVCGLLHAAYARHPATSNSSSGRGSRPHEEQAAPAAAPQAFPPETLPEHQRPLPRRAPPAVAGIRSRPAPRGDVAVHSCDRRQERPSMHTC